MREDKIVQFGSLSFTNNDRLKALPPFLASKEGQELSVIVLRNGEQIPLTVCLCY